MKTRPIRDVTTYGDPLRPRKAPHPRPSTPGGKLAGRRTFSSSRTRGNPSRLSQVWFPPVSTSTPASKSSRATGPVSPTPPAAFSPLAMTRSTSRCDRSRDRNSRPALLPGLPTTSPRKSTPIGCLSPGLPGVFNGARLADHGDADLTGIGQFGLDLFRDVPREHRGHLVAHLVAVDDDANLPPGLDGVGLLHPRERLRDLFQVLQTLEVVGQHLAARPRPCAGERIGRLDENGQYVPRGLVLVVGGDGVNDAGGLAVLLVQVGSDQPARPPGLA